MLTVLMASHNGAATLARVLDAYCALQPPSRPWQLVVIDNGSTDGTAQLVDSYADRLPLLLLHEPRRGKNVALNRALDRVLGDAPAAEVHDPDPDHLLILTDDDAIPASDWLRQWDAVAAAHPDYAVFGGAIVADWAAPPPDWLRLVPTGLTYGLTSPELADGPVFPGLVWGANMAVRGAVFGHGYRFDETVGPGGSSDYAMGSETEFVRRVALAGYRAWHCGAARVAHHIRAQQLQLPYVLDKARRFGRGMYRQERPGLYPELAGVPRWLWRRYLDALAAAASALWRRDGAQLLRSRWDLSYLRGYCLEAWRGSRRLPDNILVTSYSGELGGMELRMAQEVRYLQADGYAAMLALRPFDGLAAWSQRLAGEQIAVARFEPPTFLEQWAGRRRQLARARWLAPRRMRAFRADLVHIALCWTNYGASVLWLAARCGLPTVLSVHNAFPLTTFTPWQQRLLQQAFASVRGIYAVSASALAHFQALYAPFIPAGARLAVIPNPVDTDRFRPSTTVRRTARARWGVPQTALVLGSVARLSPQKRPGAALALLGELRKRLADVYLVLVGQGPLEADLRAQAARMGLSEYVIFSGFVDDVAQLMPGFDLHVLLSRNEGFGIATVEAMACGVPVVVTDVPGNADVVRGTDAGLLVATGNINPAVPAITALLADPAQRARLGARGRATAQARYSLDVVGRQVKAFYAGLL